MMCAIEILPRACFYKQQRERKENIPRGLFDSCKRNVLAPSLQDSGRICETRPTNKHCTSGALDRTFFMQGSIKRCERWAWSGTAEQAAEQGLLLAEGVKSIPQGLRAPIDFMPLTPGINPRPTARTSFFEACEAVAFQSRSTADAKTSENWEKPDPVDIHPSSVNGA